MVCAPTEPEGGVGSRSRGDGIEEPESRRWRNPEATDLKNGETMKAGGRG
jgi:hypothetical protein